MWYLSVKAFYLKQAREMEQLFSNVLLFSQDFTVIILAHENSTIIRAIDSASLGRKSLIKIAQIGCENQPKVKDFE